MMYAETFRWVLEDHILPLDVRVQISLSLSLSLSLSPGSERGQCADRELMRDLSRGAVLLIHGFERDLHSHIQRKDMVF